MNVTIETITPEIARGYLQQNSANRPLSSDHVKRLAAEMTGGRWKDNGDPVRFNGTQLIDGQHRLSAVVLSGVSIDAVVVRGLGDVFDTIDCGKRRNLADTFAVRGELNYKLLASAIAALDRYFSGKLERGGSTRKSHQVYESLLASHPGIRDCVSWCGSKQRRQAFFMPPGTVAALHYLFRQKDHVVADDFMTAWSTGAGLTAGHPTLLLRDRLIKNAASKATLTEGYMCALAIKAWNAVREGKTLRNLRYREEGGRPEEFPVIK